MVIIVNNYKPLTLPLPLGEEIKGLNGLCLNNGFLFSITPLLPGENLPAIFNFHMQAGIEMKGK